MLVCLLAAPIFADADTPPGRAARLSYARSNVLLQPSGESQWYQALSWSPLATGSIPSPTAARSWRLVLPLCGYLNPQILRSSTFLIGSCKSVWGQGSMRLTVFVLSPDNQVEIDTPNGSLTVLRPGSYRVDVDPAAGSTLVSVNSGSLQVNATGAAQTVSSGVAVQLVGTAPVQVLSVPLPGKDDFDEWCTRRDQRIR